MALTIKELQQLKGVGEILANRFIEAGLDSYAAIVSAGEDGLRKIRGINPRVIPSIVAQAEQLNVASRLSHEERIAQIKEKCAVLRNIVQQATESAQKRLGEELAGKAGDKLTRSLVRLLDTIGQIEEKSHKRLKRTGKAVQKAERRLEGLVDNGYKELRKTVKKARRALTRALA